MKYFVFLLMILVFLSSCGVKDAKVDTNFLIDAYRPEFHELHLVGKELNQVPDFEKYLTGSYKDDIWSINLQSNNIKKVDSELFEYFPNLKELNLSYNKIEEVDLQNLPLEKLFIHKNEIEAVELEGLANLKELNIGYNQLESLEEVELPEGVQVLELQHNKLEDITGVEKLNDLTKIKLEFNQLEDTDMVLLKDLKKLTFISVGENQLSEDLEKGFINFNEVMSKKK